MPGAARAALDDRPLLSAYAQARAAANFGAIDRAAQEYASALSLSPGNQLLAARTMSHALAAGDRPLAVRAARVLERNGRLGADGRFLLLAEAIRERDWKGASRELDAIEQDQIFKQLAPVARAWIAFETKRKDALPILDAAAGETLIQSYVTEHRAFLLLAMGREEEGVTALSQVIQGGGGRVQRVRIAAAAQLASHGHRDEALKLLEGDAPPLAAARALVQAKKPVPGAIDSASSGIAEFLVRVAADIAAQRAPQIALNYARLSTFLAPGNSETWLVTSDLLSTSRQTNEALKVLDNIAADDPFAAAARDGRVRLLAASGDRDAATARAEAQVKAGQVGPAEWTRLGDLYGQADRHADAANAYAKALELVQAQGGNANQPEWSLHLLLGGALEQAGRWPEAKAQLEAAYKLAPTEPVVLNYLGYSQLERRENLKEAEALVREASRLQPENASITDSLGWALYLDGRIGEAIELLERAAAARPAIRRSTSISAMPISAPAAGSRRAMPGRRRC